MYVLKNVPPVYVVLVVAGGVGDIEVIAPRAVVFGIDAVESIGDLGIHVGSYGLLGPGGIYLAGRDIKNVVQKGYGHIRGRLIGLAQMDSYGLGNDRKTCGHGCGSFR